MLKKGFLLLFSLSSLLTTKYVLSEQILQLEGGSEYNCENGAIRHSGDPAMAQHMKKDVWYEPFQFYKSIIEAG